METHAIARRVRGLVMGPFRGDLADAAAFLGVDPVQLQQTIDLEDPLPSLDALVALAIVYRLDPAWLVFGECADSAAARWLIDSSSAPAVRGYIERLLHEQPQSCAPAQLSFESAATRVRAPRDGSVSAGYLFASLALTMR